MTLAQVPKVLLDSANMSAMLLYIITNAVMFSYLMTSEQIPQELAAWMLDKGSAWSHSAVRKIILLLAGNVMERRRSCDHGADPVPRGDETRHRSVHFGIIMVSEHGGCMCHPPVGLNLYVASGITKMGITELTVAVCHGS